MYDILQDSLPDLLGGLGVVVLSGVAVWAARRAGMDRNNRTVDAQPVIVGTDVPEGTPPPQVRRYTLLGTVTDDGSPAQVTSTRPAGTIITHTGGGLVEQFELTEALLYDGTYAAEPVDRYL